MSKCTSFTYPVSADAGNREFCMMAQISADGHRWIEIDRASGDCVYDISVSGEGLQGAELCFMKPPAPGQMFVARPSDWQADLLPTVVKATSQGDAWVFHQFTEDTPLHLASAVFCGIVIKLYGSDLGAILYSHTGKTVPVETLVSAVCNFDVRHVGMTAAYRDGMVTFD